MTSNDRPGGGARGAAADTSRSRGVPLWRAVRTRYIVAAPLVLMAIGAFLVGRTTAPPSFDQQLPPNIAVPAHARLVRREDYLQEHVQNWYYAVPGTSHAALTAYYRAQLAHDGWTCFRTTTSTSITVAGKAFSGSSVYITALRGTTKAQIYTADQDYGAYLLQDDLPDRAIALKISLETEDKPTCV